MAVRRRRPAQPERAESCSPTASPSRTVRRFRLAGARFVPIVRTFAPFVAGIGQMRFARYVSFCIAGAIAWVGIFVTAGCIFGNIPTVKQNFHLVIVGIIVVSLIPAVVEFVKARREVKREP